MSDSSEIYGQLSGPAIIGLIIIVILLIVMIVALKVSKSSKSSGGGGAKGLNLVELKKQGILTPEELEKVGKAMLRQMDRQSEQERKREGLRPDDLLLDPEVRRLETMATVAKKEEPPMAERPATPLFAESAHEPTAEELDAIELPPDIQDMAESGLISPEEVQNIRKRMLAKRKPD